MTAVRSRSTHSPNCFGVAKFSATGKVLLPISSFSAASRSRLAGSLFREAQVRGGVEGIAKVEEGVVGHLRTQQYAVEDL